MCPRISCIAAALLAAPVVLAAETTLSLGGDFSVYDNPRSQQGSLPLDLSYRSGDWTFEGQDTYYYREGVLPSSNKPRRIGGSTERIGTRGGTPRPRRPVEGEPTALGWGDFTATATYAASLPDEHHMGVDLVTSVTIPTGSRARNFSTTATEYGVGATLTRLVGPMTYAVNAVYFLNGNQSGQRTEDNWSSQLSAIYATKRGSTIGLQFNWAQAVSYDMGSNRLLALVGSVPMSKRDKLSVLVGHGFGQGDPVTELSASVSHRF